ncbi:hypothetical protein FHS41_007799 [Streptomyces violarus]|uniref:Uncharacterized protein n=1 Tax=Streptomyces violarus TaxID=67380 RepID=A0A7W5F678_9ACTN|nr:hypothetical protein [Streptomyces violarus]
MPAPGGRLLPATHGSLARGASAPLPGALFALALTGGMTLGPGDSREVLFGRNRPRYTYASARTTPRSAVTRACSPTGTAAGG